MQNIYNKLAKNKKVDLKTRKVNLNKLDEIQEMAHQSAGNYDYAIEQVAEAHKFLMTAWDIIRFEYPHATDAQDELNRITASLDDIGLPYPPEVEQVQADINYSKEQFNQVLKDMEWWGIDHGEERMIEE